MSAIQTTIGKVKKDKKVDKATVLAILFDIFFGEYISLIKKVRTADGIEA